MERGIEIDIMGKTKVTIDKAKLRKTIREAGTKTFTKFADFAQSFIVEEKRDFPRNTYRDFGVGVTGKFAGSPRDVVDSGKLRDSKEVKITYNPLMMKMILQWTASHAEKVYVGEGIIPPYPWVALALREFDWEKEFKDSWAEYTR